MERPVFNFLRNKLNSKYITGAFLFFVLLTSSTISYSQPTWVTNPYVSDIGPITLDLSFELNTSSNVYILVLRGNYTGTYTSDQVKTISGWSPVENVRWPMRLFGVSGPQTVTFEDLLASQTYTVLVVAESGGTLQSTPYEIYPVTTPPCPSIQVQSFFGNSGECVNIQSRGVFSASPIPFTETGILKGTEWTIDWGDGSPLYTYISTANDDIPVVTPHIYTTTTDCNYVGTWTIENPCGEFLNGSAVFVVHGRDIPSDGDGELRMQEKVSHDQNIYYVCEGVEHNITLVDVSTWNCQNPVVPAPLTAKPNDSDRTIQFVYGQDPSGAIMNTITGDVVIGGANVANGAGGYEGTVITPIAPPNPEEETQVITIPETCQDGELFYVYLKNWNKCNSYTGDPSVNYVSDYFIIEVINAPDEPVISTPQSYCEGSVPVSLSATPNSPSNTINWYSDAALTNLIHTGTSYTHGKTSPGTYNYWVTETSSGNSCEGPAAQLTLIINPIPSTPTIARDISDFCYDGVTEVTLTANPNTPPTITSYQWYRNGNPVSGETSSTIGLSEISESGTYTVTTKGVAPTYCESDPSNSITVNIYEPAEVDAGPATATFCSASPYNTSGSYGGSTTYVTWYTSGDGSFGNIYDPTTTYTPGTSDISSGTVTLTLQTNNPPGPCGRVSDNIVLTVIEDVTVSAGTDGETCSTGTYTLSDASLSGDYSTITWGTDGDGSFDNTGILHPVYTPGSNDISNGSVTLTIDIDADSPCGDKQDDMTLTVNEQPVADAGSNGSVCSVNTFTVSDAAVSGDYSSLEWFTGGDGNFTAGQGTLSPTYSPGSTDISNGTVTLTLRAYGAGSCAFDEDDMALTVIEDVTVDAGSNGETCSTGTYSLSGSSVSGDYSTITWSTAGDGSFNNTSILHPVYTPGSNDISNGTVVLTIDIDADSPCGDKSDNMTLTVNEQVVSDAGSDAEICSVSSFTVSDAGISGDYSSMEWFTGGDGNFTSGQGTLTPTYTPGSTDISSGSVILTLRAYGTGSCIDDDDDMTLTIYTDVTVDAGSNGEVCSSDTYTLSGSSLSGDYNSITWSTAGDGSFDNTGILHPVYTPGSNDISNGSVVLTIDIDAVSPCGDKSDNMTLAVTEQPVADAGSAGNICEGSTFTVTDASADGDYSYVEWTSAGDGSFNNPNALMPVYTPGTNDISGGTVTLTLTAYALGSCADHSDNMILTIEPALDPGIISSDQSLCNGDDAAAFVSDADASGGQAPITYQWYKATAETGPYNAYPGGNGTTIDEGVLALGSYYYFRQAMSSGVCAAQNTDTLTIVVNPGAPSGTPANLGSNSPLCENSILNLDVDDVATADQYVWDYSWDGVSDDDDVVTSDSEVSIDLSGVTPGIYTVKVKGRNGCGDGPWSATTTVQVVQIPDASASTNDAPAICNGSQTDILFDSDISATGTWTVSNAGSTGATGGSGLADGSRIQQTLTNNGTSPVTVTYHLYPVGTVAPNCEGLTIDFDVIVNPTAQVVDPSDQVVCNSGSTTAVTFTTNRTGGTTTYEWTNDNTSIGLGASGTGNIGSFTATNTGTSPVTATITVTPTFSNGGESCTGPSESFTITVNPTAQVNDPSDQVVCNSSSTSVTFTSNRTGGTTTYEWTNDNTSIGLGASGTGNIGSFTVTNTGTSPITANIEVTPTFSNGGESCTGPSESFTITVNPTAQVDDPSDQVVCNNGSTTAVTFTTDRTGGTTTYEWTNDDTSIGLGANGTGNIGTFTAANTGTSPVTATITVTPTFSNGGESCTGPSESFTITVNPTAQVVDPSDQVVCNNSSTTAVTFTTNRTGGTTTYEWTNDDTSIGLGASGTGNISSFTATNTGTLPVTATITVTPTFSNGGESCTGPSENFTITVNPTAQVNDPSDQVVCNNSSTTAVTFTTNRTGGTTTYEWTNNDTSIGLGANGTGNIGSFTATNTGTSPVTATITVTPTFSSGGESCTGLSESFTITVNPTAQVDDPSNQVACNSGSTTAVTFTTDRTGGTTTYEWTNDNTSIGLGASGTGNIGSFTVTNTGTSPITANIEVTPTFSNGGESCTGPSESFTITVNPTAQVDDPSDQVVCNNGSTTAVTFTTDRTGGTTTYEWTNDDTSIGLGASGTGNISSFTATNTGTSPVTATITVTPTFSNGGESCTGPSESFTITVNPTAQVNDPSDQVVCNNSSTTAVTFTTNRTGGTTTYEWTNDDTSIGLGANGTGNIGAFTATNAGSSPVTATITVTPTFSNGGESCTGPSESFTITVNPTAQVVDPSDQVVCNSSSTSVTFTTNRTGGTTTYEWTNDDTSIGLGASGTGNISSFTATNTGTSPVTATITVTPTFSNGGESCTGPAENFTITVNPTAQVVDPSDQVVCNSGSTTAVTFTTNRTGGTTTYEWTNDNTSIGLGASGTGNIGSFTATNTGTSPVTATITVTPTFSNGGESCTGPSESFTITVNPTAQVNDPSDQVVCNSSSTSVTFTSNRTGGTTTYEWTNDNTSIGLGASGTGNIGSFTVTNTGTSPITANIEVTPTFSNGGESCTGPSESFTITVNPTAQVDDPSDQVVCNNGSTTAVTFTTDRTGGTTTYEWTNNDTSIGLGANGTGNIGTFTAANTGTSPVTATITVTPTFSNGGESCTGPSESFTITVNPTAQVVDPSDQVVCNNSSTTAVTFTTNRTGGTTTYEWTNDDTSIGLGANGTGNIGAFTATNAGSSPVTATITVTPTFSNGGESCTGPSESFTITVNPTAQVNGPSDQVVCNSSSTSVTFTTNRTGGTTTYEWTNNDTSIGLGASGTGNISSFTATNTGTSPVTATITVTPTFSNGGESCTGPAENFTITVNPTAQVVDPSDQVVCNSGSTTAVTFTTNRTGGTTTYEWTNDNTSIGLGASGTGNIGSFAATNTGTSPVTATITVTPTFSNGGESCTGPSESFTITVNPTAQVNDPSDQVVCNSSSTSVTFTSNRTGGTTTYEWTNDNTSIGLGASGTGNIGSFTVTNTGTSPITANIEVTPTFSNGGESCTGPSESFTITVNPTAQVDDPSDQVVCNNGSTTAVTFTTDRTGGTTTYEWTNDDTSIGLGASGTGNISSFTATNTGTSPVTAAITVTPTFSNGGESCTGPSESFTITVNPTPVLTSTLTPSDVCSNDVFSYTPASATAGTSFSWERAVVSGITPAGPTSGSDNPNETLVNITSATIPVTYEYTLEANGCSNVQNVVVNIRPEPVISAGQTTSVCSDNTLDYQILLDNFTNPVDGVTFTWSAPVLSPVDPGFSGGMARSIPSSANITDAFTNTMGAIGTATYIVTPYYNGCVGSPVDVVVEVGSEPVLDPNLDKFSCSNTPIALTLQEDAGSVTPSHYNIISVTVDPDLTANAGNAVIPETNAAADFLENDRYTNTSGANQDVVYRVQPVLAPDCYGDPVDVTVTIRPEPVIQPFQVKTVCSAVSVDKEILLLPVNTPAGTTFDWPQPTMSDASVQGTAGVAVAADPAGTFHITDILSNFTGSDITAEYYVTPTSSFGCAGEEVMIEITVQSQPVTSAITGEPQLCIGATNEVYSVTNTPGSTYSWTVPANMTIVFDNNLNFIIVNATTAGSGNIEVTETNLDGCVGLPESLPVTVSNYVVAETVNGPDVVCKGETGVAYSVPDNAGSTYQWYVPAGVTITSDPALHEILVDFGLDTGGDISVVETNVSGCVTVHNPLTVTVNTVNGGMIGTTQAVCSGDDPSAFTSTTDGSGAGAISYRWQESTDNVVFNDIAGANAATYDAGPAAQDMYYKRITTSSLSGTDCTAESNVVSVLINDVDGGTIGSDQTICEGSYASGLTSTLNGSGSGAITYRWQDSPDNITFTDIPGETFSTLSPGALTADRYYKRITISTLLSAPCEAESNVVTVTVINFDAGSIDANQTICEGDTPAAFGSVTPTGDGVFTYQWQESINGANYTDISGANSETYSPPSLTQDRWYKRLVTSTLNATDCTEETNVVKVTVINFTPGSISSAQTICEGGTPNPLTSVSPSGDGTFTYQWQNSTDGISYSDIGGANSETYSPPALTQDTWYRREVNANLNGTDCVELTNAVKITVNNFDPGSINANQTICEGDMPSALTSVAATADGTITYQWQNSSDGTNFYNITGATSDTYSPAAITADTWYRRVVTSSLNGVLCTEETNTVKVTVNNFSPGSIDANQTICEGDDANAFTSVAPTGDFSSVSYQWYSSTDGTNFNPVAGATNETYDPGALTADTWYKREVNANLDGTICTEETNVVKVTVINFDPGSIDANQTICEGSNANPLSSVTPTGDGSFTYRWYSSTDGTSFNLIAGATGETYNPGTLTQDTWYKREVDANLNGTICTEETNVVRITVINFDAGSIDANQTICEGDTPAVFGSVTPTGDGVFTYQWQESVNGANYTDISGANSETYSPPSLTQDRWYKRLVTSTLNATDCTEETNVVKVTVINFTPGSISSAQTICEGGTPNPLTSVSPSGDGTFTYQWQNSTDGISYADIGGASSETYSPPALTQDTWYRREVNANLNGTDCVELTNAVKITVNNFDPGSINANQTVCEGDVPAPLTVSVAATADGTISYQWQSSSDGTNFYNITGATSDTYSPAAITADTWYRRVVTSSLNGVLCTEETNTVKVTVNNFSPGSIDANQTICEGDDANAFTSVTPTGDFTSVAYQWYSSSDGTNFNPVAGAINETYDPGALTVDTWYKREVNANLDGTICTEETNVVKVTVINFDPGSIDANQTICEGSNANPLSSVTPTGDGSFTYRWYNSTDGTSFNLIAGATGETYNPGTLTQDTWYKREVDANLNGTICTEETNVVRITVINFDAGSINANQAICEGDTPAAFGSVTPTGDGVFTYQWQESINGANYTDISGANSETYSPPSLTQDRWYKRLVTSTLNATDCTEETNVVKVTVINFTPGSISSAQTICEGGTPNPLTSVSPSGDGTFTYQWQNSTDGISYSDIGGANSETYSPPALTQDTWYRREVNANLNGTDCVELTNAVKITVNNFDPGSINANQTICEGDMPSALTSVAATADGTITYQWQNSSDGTNFYNITGATSDTYSPAAITADTWYRRVVTSSLNGVLCTEETNTVKVTVNNFSPGSIDANQTICEGDDANAFTSVAPTGDFSSVSYQWYSSTDGTNFNPVAGATNETYDPGALTADTWYKREVNANLDGTICTEETNVVKVTVINFDPGSIDANQTICEGSNANSLTSVSPAGDGSFSYQWYRSTDGTSFTSVPGAIYETYNPGALTQDTWYKREVNANLNGTICTEETNVVRITVINFDAGSINANQTICEGDTPAAFGSVTPTGDGVFTYQWQESVNGTNYTDISGASSETYSPPALTQDTWYKRKVDANLNGTICTDETNVVKITVINFNPGSINANQTICEGGTPNPLSSVSPSGDGTFTYQWQNSTDGVNYTDIGGANTDTYSPPALTQDTWYRREVNANLNGTDCVELTNAVKITVNNFDPGSIDANQTICEGDTPAALTSVAPAGDGTFTYQWMQSTDGINFSNISGATNETYAPPALTADAWYKRQVRSTLNSVACTEETNTVKVTVNNFSPGSIDANQTICEGDNANAFTSVTPTGDFTSVAYQWYSSTDGTNFNPVAGAINETYDPGALTADTWYKREVTATLNGVDCIEETNTVRVTVTNFDPGSIDADQTICEGSYANSLTSVSPAGDGSFTYQWYSSADGTNFNVIAGATGETYNPGILTADTWYKREVNANLNGTACTKETNVIKITVINFDPGSIDANQTICEGDTPAAFTSVDASGDGTFVYQWQESSDGYNFTDITGETGETYSPPALTHDTWYKRMVTASLSGTDCTDESNIIKITVNNLNPGTIGTDKDICYGDDPAPFISVAGGTGDGTVTYRWQVSIDGVNFTDISGATNATYDEGSLVQTTYYKRIAVSTLDGVDCEEESNVVTVTVNPLPVAGMTGDAVICPGTSTDIYVNVTTGTGPYLLTINNGVGVIANYNSGDPIPVTPFSAPVTYQLVSVIDANGCDVTAPHANITGSATITFLETVGIGTQPHSEVICENTDISFSVTATGEGPYTYQWYENGSPMAGETGPLLSLTAVPASMNNYQYFVDVTGGCGNTARSDIALLTVNTETAITAQPVASTICEFASTSFGVTATGSGLTYQWQGMAPGDVIFTDLAPSGTFVGVNTNTLMVFGADRTMSGYRFRVVTGGTCSADMNSDEAELTVNTAPEITSQPADTSVCEGYDGMFIADAGGTDVTWQWYVNNGSGFVTVSNDANHNGATDDTLEIINATPAMNGWLYRAVASGTCSPDAYSSFAVLRVKPEPVITQQPSGQEICEGLSATYLVGATGSGLSYQWQYNDGGGWADLSDGGIYSGTQSQQLRIDNAPVSASGTIRVAVISECMTVYSNEVDLIVNANPVVDFSGIDPLFACGGVDTQLDGNPSGGSGNYVTHSWTGQIGPLDNFTRQDPVFNTTMPGTYSLSYTVTDDNGCRASDNLDIEVEKPSAAFTAAPLSGCTPLMVDMTDMSSGAAVYRWDFGDGSAIDNTSGDVSHEYQNATSSLMYYDIKLEVETSNGCLDSMIRGITVYPEITADFEFSEDTVCSGDMVYLTSLPGAYQYYWNYGDGQSEYGANVMGHMFVNTGTAPATYTVRLTTTSYYSCQDWVEKDIVVYPVPIPQFIPDPASQTWPEATIDFTNNTNTGSWDYLWRFGDGSTSTEENPSHTYTDPDNYSVWLIVSNAFCSDSIDRSVSVMPAMPVADFDSIPAACVPHTVTMTNNSTYADTYLWEFGDGGISTAENPTYTYYESGIFRITLTATGPGGTDVESKLVHVYATPRAYFEVAPDFVYVDDEKVRCFNLSEGATSFIWEFGDGDTSHVSDPFHKYMAEGVYDITLHAYSADGCYDSYTLSPGVTVEPAGDLTFANVFRPNKEGPLGDDTGQLTGEQIDQMFFPPVQEQVSEYKLQVFNRAGVLIFESHDINKGWDGYYKDRLVMQGVYVWYVEGKYANGKPFKKTGDITLLH